MFSAFRQLMAAVCWFVTAVVLSGLAIAQVPANSSAVPGDIFSSVHETLTEAADRALAASLADQFWMNIANPRSRAAETPFVRQENSTRRLRAAIDRVNKLRPTLESILRDEGVPVELRAVVLVESGGVTTALSPKGARGIWQFMPDTARRYGLAVDAVHDDRTDIIKSTGAAGRYLRHLYATFGDWSLALAAYNAGELAVRNAMNQTESRDFRSISGGGLLPLETRNYVPAVVAAMNRLQYRVQGDFHGRQSKGRRVVYAWSGSGE
jgi:hypothetical protein